MDFIKKNVVYILILVLIFLIFVSFIYTQFFLKKPDQNINQSSLPVSKPTQRPLPPILAQGEDYQKSLPQIREAEKEQLRKDSLVGIFIQKLPYFGKSFSIGYDIDTNQFIAQIKQGEEQVGNEELDQFLKENGILDRSWLKNLTVKTQL